MKKIPILALPLLLLFACNKEINNTTTNNDHSYDSAKLINKSWYWGGKLDPQLVTLILKPKDTAFLIHCYWIVPPYKYFTDTLKWNTVGKDSLSLDGHHFRVYSVNDSVLVTSNWVVGGPGISDTTKQTFTTY
ncbi:hypothetical protein [Pinibacter aurantiacus]|uniref:Uncharacterized protein n=1 Tax=Pinibacter aurantiacus TaxID=2851599 RepID=A0A9E2S6X4_9BACT|nr:hypothetical protein [Pinibacter aurantiacus]MBV4357698.1 hypothetical protein [Pinibacter aurantiacus]